MDDAAFEAMAARVDGLRMRMQAVERRADAWRRATFAALALASIATCASVALIGMQIRQSGQIESELRTQRLVIEDPDGAELASLGVTRGATALELGSREAAHVRIEATAGSTPRAGVRVELASASTWGELAADGSTARLGAHYAREGHESGATLDAKGEGATAELVAARTRTTLSATPAIGQVQTRHTHGGATTEARLTASDTQSHVGAVFDARQSGRSAQHRELAAYAQATDASVSATDSEHGFAGLNVVRGTPVVATEDRGGRRWSSAM